jgi:hypothetical protein
MTQRTTVRLPEDLLRRAKRKAAAEGRTLTSLIEHGLRLIVDEKKKPAPARRVRPIISKAKGGLMPGVDLNDSAAIQDMEDLEYMARMDRLR